MAELDIDSLGVEQLKEQIDKLNAALAAKLKAETDEKIAEVQAIIAAYGLTKEQLFGGAAPKASKSAKEDGEDKSRTPRAIYYNAQAEKGEEIYAGGKQKPSWFSDANKKNFVKVDIPEQIEILRKHGKDDLAEAREKWLAANPDKTQSKG